MKEAVPEEYQGYPVVTPEMMREIDRRAIDEYGIPSLELMESAGRGIAEETIRYLKEHSTMPVADTMVAICCGRGNNGGDGLVAARYLKGAGYEVQAYISPPKRDRPYTDEVSKNLGRANEAGVSVHQASSELAELDVRLRSSAVILDALLGTGASGKPAGYTRKMVQCMMKAQKPIIAIDIPTGLNPETGYHSGVIVRAQITCTLGLPKRGLLTAPARQFVGELKILEIGFPRDLINKVVDAAEPMR